MALSVEWDKGLAVKYKETKISFDPNVNNNEYREAFITHAHLDHTKGFGFPHQTKYSTQETLDLFKTVTRGKVKIGKWKPVKNNRKIKIGEIEIEPHNAGHVLGSVQYEVISPEGNLVYTGDINFRDTLTMRAADIVSCDVLVMEATFGSPTFSFPPQELVSKEIVEWAAASLSQEKIPAFQADALGNAQELIRIFNTSTDIPVITHRSVTRVNKIYRMHGHELEYMDADSQEAAESIVSRKCVFIAPKGLRDLLRDPRFNVAYVSGFAPYFKGERKPFVLSDHADCKNLLEFVKETNPKLVLLCHGGKSNTIFGRLVKKRLGIEARPLKLIPTKFLPKKEGDRILKCERHILRVAKIPGFIYSNEWIGNQISKHHEAFTTAELKEALDRLTRKGFLRIVKDQHTMQ